MLDDRRRHLGRLRLVATTRGFVVGLAGTIAALSLIAPQLPTNRRGRYRQRRRDGLLIMPGFLQRVNLVSLILGLVVPISEAAFEMTGKIYQLAFSMPATQAIALPDGFYSPKKRPSGHDIGRGFKKENKGAIPSNLLQIANSESNGKYSSRCKAVGAKQHPARFPAKLPEFFIRFLTDPGDLVVDIFAGSNTTGWVAEKEGRQWLAFDKEREYLASSSFRFLADDIDSDEIQALYNEINAGTMVELGEYMQADLFLSV